MANIECSCLVCGENFFVKPSALKKGRGKYCSRECYSISLQNQIECKCERCGVSFSISASQLAYGRGRFCSSECKTPEHYTTCVVCNIRFKVSPTDIKRNRKYCSKACQQTKVQKSCIVCGVKYTVHRCNSSSKYCSRKCYANRPSNKIERQCKYCGNTFLARLSSYLSGNSLYCSKGCQSNAASVNQRGQNSPFWRGGHTKYRGENWKHQRKLAYERDGGVCQICHSSPKKGQRKNAVHHIKPARRFNGDWLSANDLSNLITLCHKCHPKVEYGFLPVPVRLF